MKQSAQKGILGFFCFLFSPAKIRFRKSKPTQGPSLSPNLHLSRAAGTSLEDSKELTNECSTTHRQAHFAICFLVSRGARGLNDILLNFLSCRWKHQIPRGQERRLLQGQLDKKEQKGISLTCQHNATHDIKHMYKLSTLQ